MQKDVEAQSHVNDGAAKFGKEVCRDSSEPYNGTASATISLELGKGKPHGSRRSTGRGLVSGKGGAPLHQVLIDAMMS